MIIDIADLEDAQEILNLQNLGYQVFREDQLTDEVVLVYKEKHSSEPFMHLTI